MIGKKKPISWKWTREYIVCRKRSTLMMILENVETSMRTMRVRQKKRTALHDKREKA